MLDIFIAITLILIATDIIYRLFNALNYTERKSTVQRQTLKNKNQIDRARAKLSFDTATLVEANEFMGDLDLEDFRKAVFTFSDVIIQLLIDAGSTGLSFEEIYDWMTRIGPLLVHKLPLPSVIIRLNSGYF